MKLQNLGQRVYDITDATINAGGVVFSGLPLGFATYNFSNGFYSSAVQWGLLSVTLGMLVYIRFKKRNNLEQLANIIRQVPINEVKEMASCVEEITKMVEANPEVISRYRKH